MFDREISRSAHDERSRDMNARRREDARKFNAAHGPAPRSIRRSIGRSIVRVGEAIAAEHGQPVASS
jgi:excinuclease UvrABC helicase subunit UvrB